MHTNCHFCQTPLQSEVVECHHCGIRLRAGAFETTAVLRQGEVVWTYLGKDSEKEVVLKELRTELVKTTEQHELLQAEKSLLMQLNDPRIPSLLAFIEATPQHPRPVLVMEKMPGESLSEKMEHHRFAEEEVKGILISILEVISRLHALSPPVLHRDIKPSNIIVDGDGKLSIVDLGIARDFDPKNDITISQGTIGYAPPEQMMGRICMNSDLYSAGMTALHLLTRKDPEQILQDNMSLADDPVSWLSPTFRETLEQLVAFNPSDRPATAGQAIEILTSGKLQQTAKSVPALTKSVGMGKLALAAVLGMSMATASVALWYFAVREVPMITFDLGNEVILSCEEGLLHESEKRIHFCGRRENKKVIKHGEWFRLQEYNGGVKEKRIYIDNIENGERKIYENGVVKSTQMYAAGKPVSTRKEFFIFSGNSGKLVAEGAWNESGRQGTWKEWDLNGHLKAECNYKEGKKHGKCMNLWANGGKKEMNYKNGSREGLVIKFRYDIKVSEENYTGGQRNGLATTWYSRGKLKEKGMYDNDLKVGEWVQYHSNGKLEAKGSYKNGRRIGKHFAFFWDGTESSVKEYTTKERVMRGFERAQRAPHELRMTIEPHKENKKWILKTQYYWDSTDPEKKTIEVLATGQTIKREMFSKDTSKRVKLLNFNEGRHSGKYGEWWPNGKKKIIGQYSAGQKVGIWETYSAEGKKISVYNHGPAR